MAQCFGSLAALACLCLWGAVAAAREVVPGLPWPQGLQGHDDENWPMQLLEADGGVVGPGLLGRYAAVRALRPGIRRYNVFWSTLEPVPSAGTPGVLGCPAHTEMVPLTEEGRVARGYHRFHCYSTAQLEAFDIVFQLDRSAGAQNAAILYDAPSFYRNPNCTGFIFGKDVIKGGCVPRADAMDDYEDYVNLLMERYGADSGANSLSHLVVWNEVASAAWMDCSPLIPNRAGPGGANPLTEAQFDVWVSTYAELVRRTATAAARHSRAVMIWTSNDRLWERPTQHEKEPLHSGVRPFLDRLWPKLANLSRPWSLAVHPYDPGNPADASEFAPGHHPQAYTFATLPKVVDYQRAQVLKYKGLDPASAAAQPFSLLFASEQGWPFPACCPDRIRGRNICVAQSIGAAIPELVGITHNFFQDSPGGSEQGGQDYGLIPGNISADLSNATGVSHTLDAYRSTAPDVWAQSDGHYCCQAWRQGCAHTATHGVFDPLDTSNEDRPAGSVVVGLHGWAWDENASLGGLGPLEVGVEVDGHLVLSLLANVSRPDIVAAGAAVSPDHGFVAQFTLPDRAGTHRVAVFVQHPPSAAEGPRWELPESPRCLCDGHPCACPAEALQLQ